PIVAASADGVLGYRVLGIPASAQGSTRSTVTPTEDTGRCGSMLSDLELAVVPLLFLIVPAALALAALFGLPWLVERGRHNAYAAFCLTLAYQYVPSRSHAESQYAEVVGMFKIGASHTWRDEISGVFNGRPFTAFEYQYRTGGIQFRGVYIKAMLHWRLDRATLPPFTLVPASTYLLRVGRTPG